MNTKRFILLLFLCGSMSVMAQKMPRPKQILQTMRMVNDCFIVDNENPTLTSEVGGKERPSNIWTRGVYYEGLMALYAIDPRPVYLNYAMRWADFHDWNFRSGNATHNADDLCAGQTYVDLYRIRPSDDRRIANVYVALEGMAYSAKVDDWDWIDAIQMAMPVFAKMGSLNMNMDYLRKMMDLYHYTRDYEAGTGLYNPDDGLWWRDRDFVPPYTEPNGEYCYWSRGNGWVYAALVRCIDELEIALYKAPDSDRYEVNEMLKELKWDFQNMSYAIVRCQRPDGFWNVSLHDPTHFGGKETTGTSLFVYGMAWGLRKGLLTQKMYLGPTLNGWDALSAESVRSDGTLAYVQGTGKEPKDGQPVTFESEPDFTDYGVGCFLLAGSEMYYLAKGKK